jgi:hypothetical protein
MALSSCSTRALREAGRAGKDRKKRKERKESKERETCEPKRTEGRREDGIKMMSLWPTTNPFAVAF